MTAELALNKPINEAVEDFGTITIRVIVLSKGESSTSIKNEEDPVDLGENEVLEDKKAKRPVSTFLESKKKGKQCCVFLVNGQRQHTWDNQFIYSDLGLKYLRNRMIVIVDCDGLKPKALNHLMQGSRHEFFQGDVYSALANRVIAVLKGDPDLLNLEDEAEEEIANMQAADELVRETLDQLIDAHHDAAIHKAGGNFQSGVKDNPEGVVSISKPQATTTIREDEPDIGEPGSYPILQMWPDLNPLRLKPNTPRQYTIFSKPGEAWGSLEKIDFEFDPQIKELQITKASQTNGTGLGLIFHEPEDFDQDTYPIETLLRCSATFKGSAEIRSLERRVVIKPPRKKGEPKPIILKDVPDIIKVVSRQPIKILQSGPDTHVKMRWNGKDELAVGTSPTWQFKVTCSSPSAIPLTITQPLKGRFEIMIQAIPHHKLGTELEFHVEAIGPGNVLSDKFLAQIVEPISPRKIPIKLPMGAQRRPPYDLRYVKRDKWESETCWARKWTGNDAGSFEAPTADAPLRIFINEDMDILSQYRDELLERKLSETTIKSRINTYIAHISFHLYQMYLKKKQIESQADKAEMPSETHMQDEIQRVAQTMIKLMQVSAQK